jgi:hypothetical protein
MLQLQDLEVIYVYHNFIPPVLLFGYVALCFWCLVQIKYGSSGEVSIQQKRVFLNFHSYHHIW